MPWPHSADVAQALRRAYDVQVDVEAWRGSQRVDSGDLRVLDGSTTETIGTGTRLTGTVTLAPATGLYDVLAPAGVQLRPSWTVRFGTGVEVCLRGRLDVDEQSVDYQPGEGITCSGSDPWSRVRRRGFDGTDWSPPRGNAVDLAVGIVRGVPGLGLTGERVTPGAAVVWGQSWSDREQAVKDLLEVSGRQGYVDRAGRLVVEPVPDLGGVPQWSLDALGSSSVLVGARRSRSREGVINRYAVYPAVPGWFPPFVVEDRRPSSPTRVDGPFGVQSADIVWPSARSETVARIATQARLRRSTSLAAQMDLVAACNPWLQPGDVHWVVLPPQGGDPWTAELALSTQVTTPLVPGGTQSIQVRSDDPVPADDAEVAV